MHALISTVLAVLALLFHLGSWNFDMERRNQLRDRKACALCGTFGLVLAVLCVAYYMSGTL